MKKLKAYLQKLSSTQKVYLGNIAAFCGDLLIVFYIGKFIDTFVTKKLVFMQLKLMGYQQSSLSHSDFLQFKGILAANAKMILFAFIIVHSIIYICGCFKKRWAITYVGRYALTGLILSAIEFIFYIKNGNGINFFTFATILLYGLSYFILKEFNQKSEQ